jgi:hypothetical protein
MNSDRHPDRIKNSLQKRCELWKQKKSCFRNSADEMLTMSKSFRARESEHANACGVWASGNTVANSARLRRKLMIKTWLLRESRRCPNFDFNCNYSLRNITFSRLSPFTQARYDWNIDGSNFVVELHLQLIEEGSHWLRSSERISFEQIIIAAFNETMSLMRKEIKQKEKSSSFVVNERSLIKILWRRMIISSCWRWIELKKIPIECWCFPAVIIFENSGDV